MQADSLLAATHVAARQGQHVGGRRDSRTTFVIGAIPGAPCCSAKDWEETV